MIDVFDGVDLVIVGAFAFVLSRFVGKRHTHDFELVGKTYAPSLSNGWHVDTQDVELIARLAAGSTSFVYKCSDKTCGQAKAVTVPGKETS
jgi:hypothetical protein